MENIEGHSTDKLIRICNELNVDIYLDGFGSRKYQDNEKFISERI